MSNNEDENIMQLGHFEIDATRFNAEPNPDDLPIIPTRNLVLFPGVTFPLTLVRPSSLETAEEAARLMLPVGLVCQLSPETEDPQVPGDLYRYGVIADVLKVLHLPDNHHTALVRARSRFRILGKGYGVPGRALTAHVKPVNDLTPRQDDKEFEAIVANIREVTHRILQKSGNGEGELAVNLINHPDPVGLINLVATHAPVSVEAKERLLASHRVKERGMALLTELLNSEQHIDIAQDIQRRARENMGEQQRNHFLQQQMEEIRQELYGDQDDVAVLEKKGAEAGLPEEVDKVFKKELAKLRRLNPQAPDWSVQMSYLETILDLPWNKLSPLSTDFAHAEEVLNEDHYGLDKVKDRILEQLAVMMNTPDGRSPILCLVGPPGVGKTSLGQSIARALGRKYQRVSLGGLHDEAEIRGHRRTYIGAMPGRIIEAIRRSGTANPVLVLDEIDKVGADYKGDPNAAMLEVLDPEQNKHFHDNYIDLDFDLSKVLFIATANTLSTLSQPLLDRLEIIDISGYLLEEKQEIALRHLLPRMLAENAFGEGELEVSRAAIERIIENYTAESGVRQLEKQLAKIVRRAVRAKMSGQDFPKVVEPENLRDILGVEKYTRERYETNDYPGVVTGLAWTAAGGEILFIESSLAPSKTDKLTLTGNLGDVMKESAVLAHQYVRAHAADYGIPQEKFEQYSLHIHVPEGAIPKDGPSAGITMATSIVSAYTGRLVKPRVAMTGEITLRGKVLPVGGIKEKILAAKRAGITTIILCKENRKDIEEIRPVYLEGVEFIYVDNISEVVDYALLPAEHTENK